MKRREEVDVRALSVGPSKLARAIRKGRFVSTRALVKQAQRALKKAGVV